MPAPKCTGTAPTTSSIFNFSKSADAPSITIEPAAPMRAARPRLGRSGPAVMATSPANAPFKTMATSMRPVLSWLKSRTHITPAAAAILVLEKILATANASSVVAIESCDPPLKPNQPNHKINVPSVTCGKELPVMVRGLPPSLLKRPWRAPRIIAPVSAAHPPTECTSVEPAKSLNPISESQPPPQAQLPVIG